MRVRDVGERDPPLPTLRVPRHRHLFRKQVARIAPAAVDNAIVMLENIVRHIEKGVPPLQAALQGLPTLGYLLWMASLAALAVTLAPFAIAAGLRISVGE